MRYDGDHERASSRFGYKLLNMDLFVAQRRVQDVRDVVVTRTLSAIGVRPCGVESMLEASAF